jgi:hypothetical protein
MNVKDMSEENLIALRKFLIEMYLEGKGYVVALGKDDLRMITKRIKEIEVELFQRVFSE